MKTVETLGKEPIRILAVDDNPTTLRLLESMLLRQPEYTVATAVNGRKALDYLYDNPGAVDIVLLDRMMPEMDGIEVCEVMKADEKLRYIPIIMQTAASRPEEISEGIKAGVFYYLTKPLISETLLSIVGSAAKQVKQHRQLRSEMLPDANQREKFLRDLDDMETMQSNARANGRTATGRWSDLLRKM